VAGAVSIVTGALATPASGVPSLSTAFIALCRERLPQPVATTDTAFPFCRSDSDPPLIAVALYVRQESCTFAVGSQPANFWPMPIMPGRPIQWIPRKNALLRARAAAFRSGPPRRRRHAAPAQELAAEARCAALGVFGGRA
jgi:hypothetical protein